MRLILEVLRYVSGNWISIGSDNGLLSVRHQAITWASADLLSIRPLETNFSEIWIKVQDFSFIKMHLKMSSAKWRSFCQLHRMGYGQHLNSLRPRQDGRHFPDDIFLCIFSNENVSMSIKISLKFALEGRINNIPALVQITAWRRPGDKSLSEPVMVSLLTHICVAWPQWVNLKWIWILSRGWEMS